MPTVHTQDVAESLGIPNLSDDVSTSLAADVEYRLREVIEVRGIMHFIERDG